MCWSHPSLLFSNFTLQYMPLPLSDATQAYRSAPEKTDQALIKVRKKTNKHCRSIQAVACSLFVFSGALIGRLLVSEKYCAAEVETQVKRFQSRKKMHHEITLKSTHTHTHKCQVVFFTHVSDYWTVVLHIYFNEVLVKKSVSNFFVGVMKENEYFGLYQRNSSRVAPQERFPHLWTKTKDYFKWTYFSHGYQIYV